MDIELGSVYLTRSGYECVPKLIAKHAQDCSIRMVFYVMLVDTFDSKAGSMWAMEESMFLKIMTLKE